MKSRVRPCAVEALLRRQARGGDGADVESHTDVAAPIPAGLAGLSLAAMGLVFAAMGLVFAALLFVPAGRLDWMLGWVYVGIALVCAITKRSPGRCSARGFG